MLEPSSFFFVSATRLPSNPQFKSNERSKLNKRYLFQRRNTNLLMVYTVSTFGIWLTNKISLLSTYITLSTGISWESIQYDLILHSLQMFVCQFNSHLNHDHPKTYEHFQITQPEPNILCLINPIVSISLHVMSRPTPHNE